MGLKKKIAVVICLLIVIISAYLLISASPILVVSVSESVHIPVGTFTTWFGIVALSLSICLGFEAFHHPQNRFEWLLKKFMTGIVVLSVLWLPFCYQLAGNWSFSFTGGPTAMKVFWFYTYGVVGSSLVGGLAAVLVKITLRNSR